MKNARGEQRDAISCNVSIKIWVIRRDGRYDFNVGFKKL